MDFQYESNVGYCPPERFNDLLEVLEIFMHLGTRFNPLPGSEELPFLQGVVRVMCSNIFSGNENSPSLYDFITKCIHRGADPKLSGPSAYSGREREDLLLEVCRDYHAQDKRKLIEFLCDYGADASLYKKDGEDLWSGLMMSMNSCQLTRPCFNEAVLTLLQRGLPIGFIDPDGNNVLHLYCRLYVDKPAEGCCQYGWFRELEESKFLDVIDALLAAGVETTHVNDQGEIPFHAFMRIVRAGYQLFNESVCAECRQRYIDAEPRTASLDIKLLRVLKYVDLLSQGGF